MSNTSKQLAEKIHMFYNLLYHIDDYIKNKKERKGQLRVSKNIRLVLREIISSKINLNYFINKEELDSYKMEKKSDEIIKQERQYIKTINPLSFNQKNLDCINLFYNSNNEMFVINYLSIEKIFSIIQFCFKQIVKQKNLEFQNKFEKENKNFVLYNTEEDDIIPFYQNYNENNNINISSDILNKMIQNKNKLIDKDSNYKNYSINGRIIGIDLNKSKSNLKNNNNSVNVFAIMNNSYKLNNVTSIINSNKRYNKPNNLKLQINKINKQMNLNRIKENNSNALEKKTLKKNISLPLINVKKLGTSNKKESFYGKEINKNSEINYIFNQSKKSNLEKNKIQDDKEYNYKSILPLFRMSKIN